LGRSGCINIHYVSQWLGGEREKVAFGSSCLEFR
jgi:hypothetical protein